MKVGRCEEQRPKGFKARLWRPWRWLCSSHRPAEVEGEQHVSPMHSGGGQSTKQRKSAACAVPAREPVVWCEVGHLLCPCSLFKRCFFLLMRAKWGSAKLKSTHACWGARKAPHSSKLS